MNTQYTDANKTHNIQLQSHQVATIQIALHKIHQDFCRAMPEETLQALHIMGKIDDELRHLMHTASTCKETIADLVEQTGVDITKMVE